MIKAKNEIFAWRARAGMYFHHIGFDTIWKIDNIIINRVASDHQLEFYCHARGGKLQWFGFQRYSMIIQVIFDGPNGGNVKPREWNPARQRKKYGSMQKLATNKRLNRDYKKSAGDYPPGMTREERDSPGEYRDRDYDWYRD